MKAYISFFVIFLFTLSISLLGFSQSGYYINENGDRIDGEFKNYKQRKINPSSVFFISSDKVEVTLTPQNCKEFTIHNVDSYVSFKGLKLKAKTGDISEDVTIIDGKDSVQQFLRILVSGDGYKLLSFNDNKSETFFYQDKSDAVIELEHVTAINSQGQSYELDTYLNQIRNTFWPLIEKNNLQNELIDLKYSESDLVDLFSKMLSPNTKSGLQNVSKTKLSYFLSTGISVNTFSPESAGPTTIQFNTTYSPLFVAGLQLYGNREWKKFSFLMQARAYKYKNTGNSEDKPGISTVPIQINYKSSFTALVQTGIGYDWIQNQIFSFNTSAGAGVLIIAGNEQEKKIFSTPSSIATEKNSEEKMLWGNLFLQSSFCYKRMMLIGTYNLPVGTSSVPNFGAKVKSFQITIGYRFR